ncbi:MAG: ABC transporter substrate-binding protein [Chloroflexi bacterium]|nr:ABC transporter substrate-binding protein [Chloroflexota bacterium]
MQSAIVSSWGQFTRRRFLTLIGFGAGAGLLSACAGTSQPSNPGAAATAPIATAASSGVSTAPPAAAAQQPKTGGVLRAASLTDLIPIDGHYHHPGNGLSSWIVYEPLIVYDDNLNPQPLLAESWDQSTDGRRISVTLRKGVQYHTGREITSDDLVYNLNRILDPKISAGIFSGFIPPDTTWSASDKYTVVISTQQPWVNVFDFFSLFNMVNKESVEGPNAQSSAVGTGPFTLVEWVQGDHATYGKNPNYWMSGRPYLDSIQLTIAKDAQAQEVEFESGALDFTLLPAIIDFNRVKDDPKFQLLTLPNPGGFFILQPNPNTPPFDDKRARQALNYAIDRQRIAQTILLGLEQPRDLPWPPGTPADEPSKQLLYNHDLDKARSLLAAAGLVGTSFETLMSNTNPAYNAIAQIIQGDLESIGVTMTITQMNQGSMLARMNAHQFQAYMLGDVWSNFQPVTVLTADASLNYRVNNADFHDPQYTSLVTAASTEVDPTKRMQLYSQINDFLLDACFDLPIASSSTRALATRQLHGIGHRRNDFFTFTDAWLG